MVLREILDFIYSKNYNKFFIYYKNYFFKYRKSISLDYKNKNYFRKFCKIKFFLKKSINNTKLNFINIQYTNIYDYLKVKSKYNLTKLVLIKNPPLKYPISKDKPYLFLNNFTSIFKKNIIGILQFSFLKLKLINMIQKKIMKKIDTTKFLKYRKQKINFLTRKYKYYRDTKFYIYNTKFYIYNTKFYIYNTKLLYNKKRVKNFFNLKLVLNNLFRTNLFKKEIPYNYFLNNRVGNIIKSKIDKLLIFKNNYLFFKTWLFFLYKNILIKFKYKKILFSFIYPNQLKKNLINSKKKILISRFFINHKRFNNKYKKIVNINYIHNLYITNFKNFFLKKPLFNIFYTDNFFTDKVNSFISERGIHIGRVKFKPGYQRLWRHARKALKDSLSLKYKYQYRLTRYLTRFFRKTNKYIFTLNDMFINTIIINSRLLPDASTFLFFYNNKYIYLNGRSVQNTNLLVIKNDIIQLIISKWYYIFYRWVVNWLLSRIKKFKKLIYRKGLSNKYKLMKTEKQKSFYSPNWVNNIKYDIQDVKLYLEVDYFSLSLIVLYEPFFFNYNAISNSLFLKINIYKLYNWKYIT